MTYHTIKINNKNIIIEFFTCFDGTMENIRVLYEPTILASFANAKSICDEVFKMNNIETYPTDDNQSVYFEDVNYERSPHVNDILKRLKQLYGDSNVTMKTY